MGLLTVLGDCARVDQVDFRAVRGANIKRKIRLRQDASPDDCGPPVKGAAAFLDANASLQVIARVTGTDELMPIQVALTIAGNASTPAVLTLEVFFRDLDKAFVDGASREFRYLVTESLTTGGTRHVVRGTVTVENSAFGDLV